MSRVLSTCLVLAKVTILALTSSHHVLADENEAAKTIDVEPQPLWSALQDFSEQSGLQVAYVATLADNVTSKGTRDASTPADALTQILDSTGLEYKFVNENTVAIRREIADDSEVDSQPGKLVRGPAPVMLAQVSTTQSQSQSTGQTIRQDDGEEERRSIEEIVVTGTNIRGVAPESSPVYVYDREQILRSGVATAQDFVQLLPQNFGGGSSARSGLPNDSNANFNFAPFGSGGSSVNLRGLGSGSTLVLLNGHRIAPSSGLGDFVDISMIPASAIERVEILTDGASSIYGADAVAGVTNFILRDDFDGIEASLRYGTVTEGDFDEYRVGVTGGESWDTGHALLVYEYFSHDNLDVEDRDFSQGAPLPNDLLPSQERHSVLASASQELSPDVEIFGDIMFARREAERNFARLTGALTRTTPSSENMNISAGGSWRLSDSWFADLSGTYSDVHSEPNDEGTFPSTREVDSDIWTIDTKASGTVFRLPGGELKLAFGGHYREEGFTSFVVSTNTVEREADRDVYAFFGEALIPIIGPDNAVPGVERLELNVSGRFEDYSDFGSTSDPKIGILWSPAEGLRLRGSYSTSFKPPPLGRVGSADTFINASRTSHWNNLLGLTPADPSIADVVVLVVGGTGDNLDAETSSTVTAGFDYLVQHGNHGFSVTSTWFDIEFEGRLGSTPTPDGRNFLDAPNIAFHSPEVFPEGTIVFNPSQDEINEILNSLDRPVVGTENPLDAEIINRALVVRNLGKTQVSGFDFNFVYTLDTDGRELSLALDSTFLESFEQQGASTTPLVERVNTLFNPVDLRLRGRAGYAWDNLAANLFVNHTDGYHVDNTAGAAGIDSWTTVDLSLSFDTGEFGNSALSNTVLRLSVLNLFDEDPPAAPSNPDFGIFGYDPTNASPLGRFMSLELTKGF